MFFNVLTKILSRSRLFLLMTVKGNPQRIFCAGVTWGDLEKAGFDDIVAYFKKRVEACFFDPVENLLLPEYKTTGFVIMATLSALIDLLSQYYYSEAKIKHKDKYKRFLREQFPEFRHPISVKAFPFAKDLADFFYEGFRCSILHNFMLSEYATIGWKTDLVFLNTWGEGKDCKEIIINPRKLTERLKEIFTRYITDLLDPKNKSLRDSFAKKLYLDTNVKITRK